MGTVSIRREQIEKNAECWDKRIGWDKNRVELGCLVIYLFFFATMQSHLILIQLFPTEFQSKQKYPE